MFPGQAACAGLQNLGAPGMRGDRAPTLSSDATKEVLHQGAAQPAEAKAADGVPCPYQKLFRPSSQAAAFRETPLACPVVGRFPCRYRSRCTPHRPTGREARHTLAVPTALGTLAGAGVSW
jgi:hypothetical protein